VKKQTGIWVDAVVWGLYRDVCAREKLRPSEPVEGFLRFVLRCGSAIGVLSMFDSCEGKSGFDAYARVLLGWFKGGRYFVYVTDEDEAPVEHLLLQAVKQVNDPELRREIEEALIDRREDSNREEGDQEGGERESLHAGNVKEKIGELRRLVKGTGEVESS
jgi:hypothetical protein